MDSLSILSVGICFVRFLKLTLRARFFFRRDRVHILVRIIFFKFPGLMLMLSSLVILLFNWGIPGGFLGCGICCLFCVYAACMNFRLSLLILKVHCSFWNNSGVPHFSCIFFHDSPLHPVSAYYCSRWRPAYSYNRVSLSALVAKSLSCFFLFAPFLYFLFD